ncbi:MAG TPA: glycosyl hydrolase 115 family protein, partial [Opitutaceae bacterium]|nr:glycosyl hydrolase 115 family protein [Opitutaceae bacterium]
LILCFAASSPALAMGVSGPAQADPLLADTPSAGDFVLAADGRSAVLCLDADVDKSVWRAAGDLAVDIERVTGIRPAVSRDPAARRGAIVIIGVLGQSLLVDGLAAAGKLEAGGVRGQWESFVVQVVHEPLPGVGQALVIAGSDRRGTVYGIYSVSEAIGVSPWCWWADVPVKRRTALVIREGAHREGPPSVKYRGIFLNDEDWGLQPWAAKTFDPELGDIGPRTYARIFELLLRLKANTLWPAMHACTKAFNLYPQNKLVADEYGIVMGSSHAEPMLRDNVTEWTAPAETYNYLTNRDGVRAYWEERVRENGRFENIYTLGMRGIHDSPLQGPTTDAERIHVLEQIFADQRALLAQHVNRDVARVPQAFTPYKEVLATYRAGLAVPADVTLVWPDDNFGYIRHFPTAEERQRPGGSGVYYHLSYLGSPLSYLWLCTTPPALIWEEMSKAYDLGARTIWIANVGDLKPAEIDTEFFLQMAWDIHRWRRDNLSAFLVEWAKREFGPEHASEIADIMADFYRLNFQRKPEHLQWWLSNEPPRPSPFTAEEARRRLEAFARLRARVDHLAAAMPGAAQDAFYELVAYPVRGAALANERYFAGEQSALHAAAGMADAADLARQAERADAALKEATRIFNEQIAGGKWHHILALEPADGQWPGIRLAPWILPRFAKPMHEAVEPAVPAGPPAPIDSFHGSPSRPQPLPGLGSFIEADGIVSIGAEHFTRKVDRGGAGWEVIPGLGRTGDSVAVFPTTTPSIEPARLEIDAPQLDYQVYFSAAGEITAVLNLLPTQPVNSGGGLHLAIALDDQAPQVLTAGAEVGSRAWAQSVLSEVITATATLRVSAAGVHTLRIFMVDAGIVLDQIILARGARPPGYLGPPETRAHPSPIP